MLVKANSMRKQGELMDRNKIEIQQLIKSTMKAVGMDLELKHESCGINMSYNFIRNNVGYDATRIQEALNEMQTPIAPEPYIQALTLHELGHALDREALMESLERTMEIVEMKNRYSLYEQYNDSNLLAMLIEEHEMNIAFEDTAWKNAEEMNKKYELVDWTSFQEVKEQGLATYLSLYNEDLQLYTNLVALHSEQIA
ncbi:integrase [Filibacter tadaridae]|uniref:Integrase n=2 Tax=Filibacter tadaridae TaxID=2483811 RepID=A0A3P5WVW7_9BACL|nr:hypothetical protein FILTAD_01371 [Filibacter tadaridae]